MTDDELRIYKLMKHQMREARSTDKTVTELMKPIKHELDKALQLATVEARIDEANGVQLAYNHMLAQTHASGSWQSMTDRREDLKAQLTALEGDTNEGN